MIAPRAALALALCLALAAPTAAAAQPTPPRAVVGEGVVTVDLPCLPGATPAVTLDGGAPVPAAAAPAPAAPRALAILLDTSATMAEAGTPFSTRLADAAVLAAALLDRAPAGSQVALITFDSTARLVLPLGEDRAAAGRALAALQAGPAPEAGALADAIRLAAAELAAAPADARAAVILAAPPALDPAALAPFAPDARLLAVGLGPWQPPDGWRFAAAQFHADQALALPERFAAFDREAAALLGLGLTRVTIPARGLSPGVHEARMVGCGEPAAVSFVLEGGPSPLALAAAAGAALALGALGYGLWRRRSAARAAAPGTARYRSPAAITTARRGEPQVESDPLCVVVWDGRQRSVHRLARRQLTVGRDPGCDIRIESEWVSGLHARLSLAGGQVEIVDLASTNGTFVGEAGRPLAPGAPEPLAAGAVVLIGPEVRLTLEAATGDDEAEP